MNKAILVGNLTRDPEHRQTPNGISVATFTVAVRRRTKNAQGGYDADFINCVAWRQQADFVSRYFHKGSGIGVVGQIQTRSYDDKNGNKRYVTEIVVDEIEFAGSKGSGSSEGNNDYQRSQSAPQAAVQPSADDLFGDEVSSFEPVDDAELPF